MGKFFRRLKGYLPTQRRLIQLYAALLHNAYIKGFITGNIYTGNGKMLCLPGLNCYTCPGAVSSCPLGALQNAIASSGARVPTYVLGILLLSGLILGRTICGFLCPFGLLQDLLHKIPTPKLRKNRATRILSFTKYAVLIIFVVLIPLWYGLQYYPVPAFCKYICPAGTLEGAVGLMSHPANESLFAMLGTLFTRKIIILLLVIGACVFIYRAFCRFLCPLGALYGLFARLAFIGVKAEPSKCTDCGRCTSVCPMDIRKVGDRECIHCGKCMAACPTKAISFRAGKITLHGSDIQSAAPEKKKSIRNKRIIAWCLALILLAGVTVLVHLPAKSAAPDALPSPPAQITAPLQSPVLPNLPLRLPTP